MTIASSRAVSNAQKLQWPLKEVSAGVYETEAPGGYRFFLEDKTPPKEGNGRPESCPAARTWCVCV